MKKDTESLIKALSSGPVRQYLTDNEHRDMREVILKNKHILGIPTEQLFEQIAVRKKAKDKVPLYYANNDIVYPPQKNFEQSSSQSTASFKSELLSSITEGAAVTAADLSGGFGVDSFFFSSKVQSLHFVEPDQSVLELARHNHQVLGAKNIVYHPATAEDFLKSAPEQLDFFYVDPSRRVETRKVVAFEESSPDIIALAPELLRLGKWLMIKGSPLLDLQAGISQLPFVERVVVVSVNNECKEVLYICSRSFEGMPRIEATNLQSDSTDTFSFTFPEEKSEVIEFSDPDTYLYEPNAAILKAGAFKMVGTRYDLKKIHPSTHLYTSDRLIPQFPGRRFFVEALVRPDPAEVKKFLPTGQVNVTTRNYPLSVADLKRKVRVKDGGDKYLIAFSGLKKKFVAIAKRV